MQSSHGNNFVDFSKGFSIIIPSWNNMAYLKKCIESVNTYSEFNHQIVVHLNEATYKEKKELDSLNIKYTTSPRNLGVCEAVNRAYTLCNKDLIMYMNDDMVALPDWDSELSLFYEKHKERFRTKFWLSSTMIEPFGNRPEMLCPYDFGSHPANFCELTLINKLKELRTKNPNIGGTTWPPNIMHKTVFEAIGGFSEEYFPGFGSDPDLAKKMWDYGVRDFVGVGRSLVYHFQCKTTYKLKDMNNGHPVFKQQHGMSMTHFIDNILKRGLVWEES